MSDTQLYAVFQVMSPHGYVRVVMSVRDDPEIGIV